MQRFFIVLIIFVLLLLSLYLIYFKKQENLIFGVSIPKSGIMKALGNKVYVGANAYFSYANESKILGDTKIDLIVYDDKYEPEITQENTLKLIRKNVFAFFGFVGTPTVKKILPILKNNDIPFIAPFSGASFLRNTQSENFINFRSSYEEEINFIVDYLYHEKGVRRIAVFYQNDNYGEEGFVALLNALKERDLTLAGESTYKRNTLSIRHALHEINNSKPEAVLLVGAYQANALFIQTAKRTSHLKDTLFCNISFGDANEMVKELDYNTKNVLFSEVVPSFNDTSKEVVREYQKLMQIYAPKEPLSFISFESFLAAKSVVSALKQIDGTITRAKFIQEIHKLPPDALGGVAIHFQNNQLHNRVYLFEYKNSQFVEITHVH